MRVHKAVACRPDLPSADKPVRYRPSAQEESEKNMIHLGDITKIHGNQIEPVHCIIFGSPCQDLSMAGLRLGFGGDRSVLFVDAVRIIGEMRRATNGMYPTFAVWENVPGAFSSNGGEDFRTVLEKLARVAQPDASIPRPSEGGAALETRRSNRRRQMELGLATA